MNGNMKKVINDDLSIVLCGEAGQGIQTVEKLLTSMLKLGQYNVFATKEYMSRVRGGSNSTQIRVSSAGKSAYVERIDILIPLDADAITHLRDRISNDTIIMADKSKAGSDDRIIDVPFSKIASDAGNPVYANTAAVGAILGLLRFDVELLSGYLETFFKSKGAQVVQKNIETAKKGFEYGTNLSGAGKIEINLKKNPQARHDVLIDGADALSMGAIAGGCNFISAYPMTPSTGIITFISRHSKEFGIIAEQAEDEISAINMAIGAWYAGARGMAATAGGGFALMIEGLSLAGMIESPLVIYVGQRPAPATGLPTRTEQGDLEHVLYSGHGEFPRIVLAPATIEDAFYLMQKAFNLADKFQTPVIVLGDQYLVDSYYNTAPFSLSDVKLEKYVMKTDKEYKRYAFSQNGISPRGIPGFGDGIVVVDSDEHDEQGHITEDMSVRTRMVDKRQKKLESIKKEIIEPGLIGSKDYKTLVIGWGSTYFTIKEAVENLGMDDVSVLHFRQVYPLHPKTLEYLKKAKKTIIVENNSTAQFARLIRTHTGFEIENKILKYNGMPFGVEELTGSLRDWV